MEHILGMRTSLYPRTKLETIVRHIEKVVSEEGEYNTVAENCEHAYRIMDRCENRACRFYFANGRLRIRKVSALNEAIAGAVIKQFANLDGFLTGCLSCTIGDSVRQPDASFRPHGRKTTGPFRDPAKTSEFPTLVVLVAHKDDSRAQFAAELRSWISDDTTVQIALGVQVNYTDGIATLHIMARGNKEEINIQLMDDNKLLLPLQLLISDKYADTFLMFNLIELQKEINQIISEYGLF